MPRCCGPASSDRYPPVPGVRNYTSGLHLSLFRRTRMARADPTILAVAGGIASSIRVRWCLRRHSYTSSHPLLACGSVIHCVFLYSGRALLVLEETGVVLVRPPFMFRLLAGHWSACGAPCTRSCQTSPWCGMPVRPNGR